MSDIWLHSDGHWGHSNIIKFCDRPFKSIDHMNWALVENWNACVSPEDTVYVLGDLAMGVLEDSLEICSNLVGRKVLVSGNHDRTFLGRKGGPKQQELYEAAGFEIAPEMMLLPEDPRFLLCHFPFDSDVRHKDKYTEFHPKRGALGAEFLCHGHVHTAWSTKDNQYNVGVDTNFFAPVSLDTVQEWAETL